MYPERADADAEQIPRAISLAAPERGSSVVDRTVDTGKARDQLLGVSTRSPCA